MTEMSLERNKGGRVKVPLSSCIVERLEELGLDLTNKTKIEERIEGDNVIISFRTKESK
jgi:hypothetical protein